MYDITFSVTICTRIKYMRFLMQRQKPFCDRLIIPAVEDPQPEVSKMTMDVSLPVAELPQSPIPKLVPENPNESTNVKKKTSTSARKTSAKPSKVPKIKSQSFPKFKKSHHGIFLITPRGKQK